MFIDKIDGLSAESHIKVQVKCDLGVSEKCRDICKMAYRDIRQNLARNDGRYICFYCSRQIKYSGRSNPNCKYRDIDDNFFEVIDSEIKAYILGWIASDGHISHGGWVISIHNKDTEILKQIRDAVSKDLKITTNREMVVLSVSSKKHRDDLCKWLKLESFGKKSDIVGFPDLTTDELKWSFIRGFFDGDGSVWNRDSPACNITSNSDILRNAIEVFCKVPCRNSSKYKQLSWSGINAQEFLGRLYKNATIKLDRKYRLYLKTINWFPKRWDRLPLMMFKRIHKDAIAPTKNQITDSGYDLTIVNKIKEENGVYYYDTGIRIQPAPGHYFELVGRSSISKTGYMLANNIGIIDATYRGPIIVALVKINPNAQELQLPLRLVQLIPRRIIHFQLIEVENIDETDRGDKGFGSSG